MNKEQFAFGKKNFLLLAVGMTIVVVGFLLMSGGATTLDHFEADIFSARRVKVAPVVCLAGFLFMIYAVLCKPADAKDSAKRSK